MIRCRCRCYALRANGNGGGGVSGGCSSSSPLPLLPSLLRLFHFRFHGMKRQENSVNRQQLRQEQHRLYPATTSLHYLLVTGTPQMLIRRQFSSARRSNNTTTTTTDTGRTKRPSAKNDQFLIPGFQQPTATTAGGSNDNSMMMMTLPILDAAVILSPGQYCKQSSWSTSYQRHRGTNNGSDAAQRLIRARRQFIDLIRMELSGKTIYDAEKVNDDEIHHNKYSNTDMRKMYALVGHGVPNGLLRHFTNVATSWLLLLQSNPCRSVIGGGDYVNSDENNVQSQQQATTATIKSSSVETSNQNISSCPPITKILFANSPNSTLLDQSQVQFIDAHHNITMIKTDASSFPPEWEYDFEMYMVVMDRMGSRLAEVAALSQQQPPPHSSSIVNSSASASDTMDNQINPNQARLDDDDNDSSNISNPISTILTPASLQQWNVTIMFGEEALPIIMCPLPNTCISSRSAHHHNHGDHVVSGEGEDNEETSSSTAFLPMLSLEWVKMDRDCWKVILRLQESGGGGGGSTSGDGEMKDGLTSPPRPPVSLVFEGEYHTTTPPTLC